MMLFRFLSDFFQVSRILQFQTGPNEHAQHFEPVLIVLDLTHNRKPSDQRDQT